MKTRFLLALCAAALLAVSASAQTVDELIEKNLKARGGADKMHALKAMKFTGKMKMGPMEAPFVVTKTRPENFRLEFTIQGMTGIQAYDSSTGTGWMVMPFMGKKDPEQMTADMLKEFKEDADFDGPIVDYKQKGNKVEYLGKEDVQGTPAYKLHVTTKDGLESNVYLDAESFLEIKSDQKRKIQGQEIESETSLGDYKEFGGVLFATSIESRAKGREGAQTVTIEKVDVNPTADATLFKMPEVKKAEEPKKEQ